MSPSSGVAKGVMPTVGFTLIKFHYYTITRVRSDFGTLVSTLSGCARGITPKVAVWLKIFRGDLLRV